MRVYVVMATFYRDEHVLVGIYAKRKDAVRARDRLWAKKEAIQKPLRDARRLREVVKNIGLGRVPQFIEIFSGKCR